jgi:hypothetical protein
MWYKVVLLLLVLSGIVLYRNSIREHKLSSLPTKEVVTDSQKISLPDEKDIIWLFFKLIQEGRISEAVMMMNPKITNDDNSKQAWGNQLNSFETIDLKSVEESMSESWTEIKQSYKVLATVKMKNEAIKASIPNYGWKNGENVKWIEVEKINNKWFINGIGSGP